MPLPEHQLPQVIDAPWMLDFYLNIWTEQIEYYFICIENAMTYFPTYDKTFRSIFASTINVGNSLLNNQAYIHPLNIKSNQLGILWCQFLDAIDQMLRCPTYIIFCSNSVDDSDIQKQYCQTHMHRLLWNQGVGRGIIAWAGKGTSNTYGVLSAEV